MQARKSDVGLGLESCCCDRGQTTLDGMTPRCVEDCGFPDTRLAPNDEPTTLFAYSVQSVFKQGPLPVATDQQRSRLKPPHLEILPLTSASTDSAPVETSGITEENRMAIALLSRYGFPFD